MNQRQALRTRAGSIIVEQPLIMTVLFIFLGFPMMNMASIGLRSYFVITSAREAAHHACKSLTFKQSANLQSSGQLANNVPATQVANTIVDRYMRSFSGIKASTVNTEIVYVNNVSGQKFGPFLNPLSDDQIDLTKNTYYLDVHVKGKIDPLISYSGKMLGNIPGLTQPLTLDTHCQDIFENPKGLQM